MRKIRLEPPATRIWQRWRAACDRETREACARVEQGEAPDLTSLYRRRSIKKSFFFSKGPPFYGKCAYCEAPITDYQHGDIEHFRPKAGVTHENDRPVELCDEDGNARLDEQGRPVYHPGYYWLAYDWRNLLPACTKCNQPADISGRKIGKHNRFPVDGRHAQHPDEVANERPLLIHPASGLPEDDPELHLKVDTEKGIIGPKSKRGRTCIEIFALNLRDQLVADRRRACREVRYLLLKIQSGDNREAARDLAAILRGKPTFTLAQRAVLREKLGPDVDLESLLPPNA